MNSLYSKESESGRTMLEMLAVLAIIGILSVIGIIGYRMAIARYKINESVNEIRVAASAIKSGNFKLVQAEKLYDEDGVEIAGVTGDTGPKKITPESYISGVKTTGNEFITTYGAPVGAMQTAANEFQLTLDLNQNVTGDQTEMKQDDCLLFINPSIGYDYIQLEGSETRCTPEDVRNAAPKSPCSKEVLCPAPQP